jgi:putative sporulation protein YyaC
MIFICNLKLGIFQIESSYIFEGGVPMYLAKVNYKKENVAQVLSLILKDIINENTIVICIGTDRSIGDALGPLVGTMLKNSDFKYPVYGTLDNPIHALNIYESIEEIKRLHPKGEFLAIDACLGSKNSIGNIQIRKGPILPGKGVGKKLPQVGSFSIVGIVDKIDENNRFSFNNVRLSFVLELAETVALSLLLAT